MSRPDRPLDKFGFPLPVEFHEPPAPRRGFRLPESPHTRRILTLLVIVVIGCLLTVPWIFQNYSKFMSAKQRQSAAILMRQDEPHKALEAINKAIAWAPEDHQLIYERVEIQLAIKDFDAALKDANEVVEKSPNFALGYSRRAEVHHRRHELPAAIQDAKDCVLHSPTNDLLAANSKAYLCALAGVELEESLQQLETAIKNTRLPPSAAIIDTRAYLYFKLDRLNEALEDVNTAIRHTEKEQAELEQETFPPQMQREVEYFKKMMNENLAVMYHHRGEIQAKLGNSKESESDLELGKKLGYDPSNGVE